MKYAIVFILLLTCSCSWGDNRKVMKAYREGNPHARDLLLHGFTYKFSEQCDSELLDNALNGDQESKEILYAQINVHIPDTNKTYIVPAPIIIPRSR